MKFDFDDNELKKNEASFPHFARSGRAQKGDLVVEGEHREKGGVSVEIESSVKALFGARIEDVVRDSLRTLSAGDVHFKIKDNGALDHVIMARVETVARQLWAIPEPGVLPQARAKISSSKRDRPRRTRLYLPGNNPDIMLNAGLFGADCIILDLEDSVAQNDKWPARILVRNSLLAVDFGSSEKIVRVNPLTTANFAIDLEIVVPAAPDVLLIPKCENAEDLQAVEQMLIFYEKRAELTTEIMLMPLIETAKGVLNAAEIATASVRNVALCFGAEDFTADIGAERTAEGKESFVARNLILLAAKAAGLQALDTVYSDVEDMDGLIASTCEAMALGFDGKGVIHPGQVEPIHRVFAPTQQQVDYAGKVIAAIEEAEKNGMGVATLGTKMIDAPVVARAKRILALAEGDIFKNPPQITRENK
ncbi:MAG: HpcH/HpaI aldolase/citrate lyase family protein [Calditrichaeota bacterium]|nr:HpcH/HpaI aldolase/citrate lyase family protein [Calditrichota bacterium]